MKLLAALSLVLAMASVAGANNAVSLGYTNHGTVIGAGLIGAILNWVETPAESRSWGSLKSLFE